MGNYEELTKKLRNARGGCQGIKMAHDAADAIEQLMRERDAAVKDLKYLPFTTCKWVNTDKCKNSCLCERYEWRGVQE